MFSSIVSAVAMALTEEKAFRDMCASLPEKEAKNLIKQRDKRRRHAIKHQEKLEIAKAGRSKNFWGSR
jgi:hypothetical protein